MATPSQVNYAQGSTLNTGRAACTLVQFHIHAPSKHTLDGAHTPMELHLVHRDASGHLAVVGVMIVQGAYNPAYETFLAYMPDEEGEPVTINGASLNAVDLCQLSGAIIVIMARSPPLHVQRASPGSF